MKFLLSLILLPVYICGVVGCTNPEITKNKLRHTPDRKYFGGSMYIPSTTNFQNSLSSEQYYKFNKQFLFNTSEFYVKFRPVGHSGLSRILCFQWNSRFKCDSLKHFCKV